MNTFSTFVTTGTFARLLATFFLFCMIIGAAVILSAEIISGQPLNAYAIALVSAGLSYSLTIVGVHIATTNGATTP